MTVLLTPVSSMVWVFIGSIIGSMGAAFLKGGAQRLERNLRSVYTNWRLAAGISAYLTSAVFFVLGLRKGELSVLYPMVSLGYIFTLAWSHIFFGEPITRTKLLALGLILTGIALLGFGQQLTPIGFPR
jgi:Membrane transporters of cations and cationic drugs